MKKSESSGFTIVEMLVVIGIFSLLIAMLMPMLRGVRAESHSTQCLNNLRQIFLAVETYRQSADDLLPFARVLPTPMSTGPEGGLNSALQYIIPHDSECYRCPADFSQHVDDLHTSYSYGPGGFMVLWVMRASVEPQYDDLSDFEMERLAARQVTYLYESGFLRALPILIDSEPRHAIGDRLPQNVVFIDGSARPRKPQDDDVVPPPGESAGAGDAPPSQ